MPTASVLLPPFFHQLKVCLITGTHGYVGGAICSTP